MKRQPKILFIDDQVYWHKLFKLSMPYGKYEIVCIEDFKKAKKRIEDYFDLVILDLNLIGDQKEMEGFDLQNKINDVSKNTSILFFTNYSERILSNDLIIRKEDFTIEELRIKVELGIKKATKFNPDICNEIIELTKNSKHKKVIDLLHGQLTIIGHKKGINNTIAIAAQYNQNEKKRTEKLISKDDYDVELANITKWIIDIKNDYC